MIPGLVAHLWQSTLFAGVVWLLALTLRKNQARVRYGIWFIASAKFLIPFSVLVGLGALAPRRAAVPAIQSTWIAVAEQVAEPLATVPAVAARVAVTAEGAHPNYFVAAAIGLWACGFVAIAGCWSLRWKRVHALRKAATPVRIPNAMEFAVPVMSAPGLVEPGIVGILRPVLLLPKGIEDQLDSAQLDAILVHELCHVRRHDNLTAMVHMVVQATFWFHPLVWWLGARLVDERERACDEEVLWTGCRPQVYAAGILNVCKLYGESPLVCVSGVTGANLKRRIEAIMANRRGIVLNRAKTILLASAGVVALAGPVAIGVMIGVGDAPAIRAQSPIAVPAAGQILPPGTSAISKPQTAQSARVPAGEQVHPPAAEQRTFDAASVRQVPPDASGRYFTTGIAGSQDPKRFHYTNTSLSVLLHDAYDVEFFQIDGPAWMGSECFDVQATMPPNTTKTQLGEMLQSLLSERFKLVVHRETRELPIYSLVVAKGGPKMKESEETEAAADDSTPPQPGPHDAYDMPTFQLNHPGIFVIRGPVSRVIVKQQTIGQFASRLANPLGRKVVDATGLTAKYDFTVTFANEGREPQREFDGAPDVRVALQEQLGLRLEAGKGPVEVIVVDHIEKTPTEN